MKVFITGASSGIGRALAQRYAEQGATLGLVARRAPPLVELVDALSASGGQQHRIYATDVTDTEALSAAAQAFLREVGTPDVVIASAGVSAGTLTENAEDMVMFRRIIDTNLLATVATFAPFIGAMRERPGARLVGIASVAGVRGMPGSEAYSASKAAVISYCESLRVEMHASAIRIVTIVPGYIATPMTAKNPYRMPFLMSPERFARQACRAIARGDSLRIIPWQMAIVARVMRLLPNAVFDRAFARAPRKPRAPH